MSADKLNKLKLDVPMKRVTSIFSPVALMMMVAFLLPESSQAAQYGTSNSSIFADPIFLGGLGVMGSLLLLLIITFSGKANVFS